MNEKGNEPGGEASVAKARESEKTDNPVFEEAGFNLRAIRKSKGLTLNELSSSTRVSLAILKAIEGQRFELLPEQIYARAFINSYANALDIDSKEILSLYESYLKSLELQEDKHEMLKNFAIKRQGMKVRLKLLVIMTAALIFLIGASLLYQRGTGEQKTSVETIESPAVEIQEPAGNMEVSQDESAILEGKGPYIGSTTPQLDSNKAKIEGVTPEPQPELQNGVVGAIGELSNQEKSYTMTIEASELTWIKMEKDGGLPVEIILKPGEQLTEIAYQGFGLLIGNAGGVDISFQGNPLGPLGKHGEVVNIKLPKEE